MAERSLKLFEYFVRRAHLFSDENVSDVPSIHPFEERNISEKLPTDVRALFDNSHYAQATFESLKFLDKEVARIARVAESGMALMMKVFSETSPYVRLNPLSNVSEIDEQKGFKFIFAGSILAIRNPRGHEYSVKDTMDDCLDHLTLVSMLVRRIESAGYSIGVE